MSDSHKNRFILPCFVMSIGIALAGFFVSKTLYNAKVALNTAESKGLAERRVISDRANWKIGFSVGGKNRGEIPALYNEAEKIEKRIISLLKESGFGDEEISKGVINYRYQDYRNKDQVVVDQNHYLNGSISVETQKVKMIAREANQNARIAANEFASNAGVEVGGIRSARQGGFIVRDAGEEHGDSRKIEKDVRVVTTITFFLTD